MKKIIMLSIFLILLSSFVNAQLLPEPIVYHDFEDATTDNTGNGYTATDISTTSTTGINGNGRDLSGSNQGITLARLTGYTHDTIQLWFNPDVTVGTGSAKMLISDSSGINYIALGGITGSCTNEVITTLSNGAKQCWNNGTISSFPLGSWYNVIFTWNTTTSRYTLYVDGVNYGDGDEIIGVPAKFTNSLFTSALNIGEYSTLDIDTQIDEYAVWDVSLTQDNITYLQTNFYPYVPLNVAPDINLTSPVLNDHLNDEQIILSYNIYDTDQDLLNCTVKVNGSTIETYSNINFTGALSQTTNYNNSDGAYNWVVNCTDGVSSYEVNEDFIIDRSSPDWTIKTISTDNTSIIDRSIVDFVYFNDSLDDTYLFAYNVTVKYPNGTIWFSNQTIDLNVTDFQYEFNKSIDTIQPNGTYSINYYAEDDHTAKKIKDYTYKNINKGLEFTTDTDLVISLGAIGGNMKGVSAVKLEDRYTFDFEFNDNKKSRTYNVVSSEKLYYRGNLYPYPVFVTGKHWIDFNLDDITGVTYEVIEWSDYDYTITINTPNPSKTNKIRSLGGLNIVNETYTFQIKENSAPIIVNTTPTQYFQIDDNEYINFTTIATDLDNDTITYYYYFNGVLNYTGQNLTNFLTPYNSHGVNNMTVIATDGGKSDSYTWDVNITHNPLGATITSLTYSPVVTWYSNIANTKIVCSGIDGDNETNLSSLGAEIQYRTNLIWSDLTPVNDGNGTFNADINISLLEGSTLDTRCRITDFDEGFTDWTELNNFVTIQQAYTSMTAPNKISPSNTNEDFVTQVTCKANTYGSEKSYKLIYDIDAYYNSKWYNVSYDLNNKALFDMAKIDYGEKLKFRCRILDGINATEYITGLNVTRKHITNLFMFNNGQDEVMKSNSEYYKGLKADLFNEENVSIIGAYVDCNGNDYWDYYYEYSDNRNVTSETFKCNNMRGVVKHTVGILINKTGQNDNICGSKTNGLCKLQRSYEVVIK